MPASYISDGGRLAALAAAVGAEQGNVPLSESAEAAAAKAEEDGERMASMLQTTQRQWQLQLAMLQRRRRMIKLRRTATPVVGSYLRSVAYSPHLRTCDRCRARLKFEYRKSRSARRFAKKVETVTAEIIRKKQLLREIAMKKEALHFKQVRQKANLNWPESNMRKWRKDREDDDSYSEYSYYTYDSASTKSSLSENSSAEENSVNYDGLRNNNNYYYIRSSRTHRTEYQTGEDRRIKRAPTKLSKFYESSLSYTAAHPQSISAKRPGKVAAMRKEQNRFEYTELSSQKGAGQYNRYIIASLSTQGLDGEYQDTFDRLSKRKSKRHNRELSGSRGRETKSDHDDVNDRETQNVGRYTKRLDRSVMSEIDKKLTSKRVARTKGAGKFDDLKEKHVSKNEKYLKEERNNKRNKKHKEHENDALEKQSHHRKHPNKNIETQMKSSSKVEEEDKQRGLRRKHHSKRRRHRKRRPGSHSESTQQQRSSACHHRTRKCSSLCVHMRRKEDERVPGQEELSQHQLSNENINALLEIVGKRDRTMAPILTRSQLIAGNKAPRTAAGMGTERAVHQPIARRRTIVRSSQKNRALSRVRERITAGDWDKRKDPDDFCAADRQHKCHVLFEDAESSSTQLRKQQWYLRCLPPAHIGLSKYHATNVVPRTWSFLMNKLDCDYRQQTEMKISAEEAKKAAAATSQGYQTPEQKTAKRKPKRRKKPSRAHLSWENRCVVLAYEMDHLRDSYAAHCDVRDKLLARKEELQQMQHVQRKQHMEKSSQTKRLTLDNNMCVIMPERRLPGALCAGVSAYRACIALVYGRKWHIKALHTKLHTLVSKSNQLCAEIDSLTQCKRDLAVKQNEKIAWLTSQMQQMSSQLADKKRQMEERVQQLRATFSSERQKSGSSVAQQAIDAALAENNRWRCCQNIRRCLTAAITRTRAENANLRRSIDECVAAKQKVNVLRNNWQQWLVQGDLKF